MRHRPRVVSLTCSNTEIVCALGCEDLLVGVDDHSDFPEDVVARLPRVGPDLQIDLQAVRALEPDLVLASLTVPGHEKVVDGLEQAGLPYIAPAPVSLKDVYRDLRDIGKRLGASERAEEVVAEMKATIPATAEDDIPDRDRPRILIQWWPKPLIAPGRKSWVTDLIAAAGGSNPLGDEEIESRPVPDEEVRELAPDAMVISWCGVRPEKYRPEVVYRNEAFQGLRFVDERRVVCIPEAYLGRPSPRLVDGYRALRAVVEACRRPMA